MRPSIVTAVLLHVALYNPIFLIAQRSEAEILTERNSSGLGTITTFDGKTLKGFITYNDNEGIVSIKDDGVTQSLTARNLIGFEYTEKFTMTARRFMVMDYNDPDTGQSGYSFFEILQEFETFAVLSRKDRIKTEPKKPLLGPRTSPMLVDKSNSTIVASQTETIFFINDAGQLQPFVKILEKEIEGLLLDRHRNKNYFINKDLFEQYTGSYYKKLMQYAEENDFSLKVKEDLILVLARYKEISE